MLLHPSIYQLIEQGWAGSREHGVVYQQQSTLAAWCCCMLLANTKKGSGEWLRPSKGKKRAWMRSNNTRKEKDYQARRWRRQRSTSGGGITDRKHVSLNVTPSHSMERQGLHPGKLVAHGIGEVGSEPAVLLLQGVYTRVGDTFESKHPENC